LARRVVEGVQEISRKRRCYTLSRFPQEERDRIADVVKIWAVSWASVQMDGVGGGTEPVLLEGGRGAPTWSVGIAASLYDASVLESHLARLTTHSVEIIGTDD
jgi:hypothetical protein